MKQTGALLKTTRENAKLSLSEVALSTKINPKILTSIENGDTTNLPALTFLKGFIRSYALFLKLDPEEVMKVFNAESGLQPPAPPVMAEAPVAEAPRPVAETPTPTPITKRRVDENEGFKGLRALAVAVIVVLIGVIIGVRELVEKYQREKVVDATAEIKVEPIPIAKEEPKKAEEPKKVEESKKETPVEIAKVETKAEEPTKEEPKKEEPKKEEPKPIEKPATVAVAPTPAPAPVPTPDVKPASIVKSVKSEIILEALDKVDVQFKIHGETKKVSLGPTQVHTIFADEPMVLDVSDGGALNVILNGRERGVPGDLGKPTQVKIP